MDEVVWAVERWMTKSRISDRGTAVKFIQGFAKEWKVPWMEAPGPEVLNLFEQCLAHDAIAGMDLSPGNAEMRAALIGIVKGRLGYQRELGEASRGLRGPDALARG